MISLFFISVLSDENCFLCQIGNGRLLYWGIFKAQLMLKTTKGEYLIAQINDPNAEKFFGMTCCLIEIFFTEVHVL